MIQAILAFFSVIPGLGKVAENVTAAVYDAKVRMLAARTGTTRDVAVQTIQAASADYHTHATIMQTIAGVGPLLWLVVAFAVPIVAYETKVIVWDTMLDLGTTEPIKGQVAEWMNTIINWLFGASTALAAGGMGLKAIRDMK